jgi:SAM-dependent methyltransferase
VNALERWRRELAGWAIPDEILAAAPESPWGFPPELFRSRAERTPAEPSVTTRVALDALGTGGDVVDVGVGGGATSLPLAAVATRLTGVDESAEMLAGFLASAREAGVQAGTVEGRLPEASPDTPTAEVVVCGHVLYNVGELEPFVRALGAHARRRVVVEITSTHPLVWMADLWRRFHGLERPTGPGADLAVAAIGELGIEVRREDEARVPRSGGFERREDAIAFIRRRLCLSADRDAELAEALGGRLRERDGLWAAAGPLEHPIVTLWWDRPAT